MRKSKQARRKQIEAKGARSFRQYRKLMANDLIDPELQATRAMIDTSATLGKEEIDAEKLEKELDALLDMAKDKVVEDLSNPEETQTQGDTDRDPVIPETHVEKIRTCDGEHACGEHQCDCKYTDEKVEYKKPEILATENENTPECPNETNI